MAERRQNKISYFWIVGENEAWFAHCYWDKITISRYMWKEGGETTTPTDRSEAESLLKRWVVTMTEKFAVECDPEYRGWKFRYIPDASKNRTLLSYILKAKCGVPGYEYDFY